MNKEAKIGLTIILVLLITFAAVVAKRLYSTHAAGEALAAEDKGGEKSGESANTEKETFNKVDKLKTTIALAGQPTVVAAIIASGKPPQGAASDEDQWSTATDFRKAKQSAGGASDPMPPPSYMPEPPKADVENRYDRYGTSAGGDSTDYRNGLRHEQVSTPAGAGRTYIVAEGDTLFDIARCELGKASRWVEIYDLNADVLGKYIDRLVPGTEIVLPDDSVKKADTMMRHPTMR